MSKFIALKRLGFATISSYMELLGGFIVSAIVARSLGPDDYGAYAFLIWMSGLVVAFSNMGVGNAAIKFVAESHGAGDMATMAGVRRRLGRIQLGLISAALFAFLSLTPFVFLPRIPDPYEPAIWFLVIASSTKAMYMLHFSVSKGMENFSAVAQVVSLTLPVQLAMVGWAAWQDQGVMTFIIVHTCTSIFSLLLMRRLVRRNNPQPPAPLDSTLTRRINRHVVLVSMSVIVFVLGRQQIEIYFLGLYSTQASIAYFSLAFALTKAARELLPGVLNITVFPMLARTYSSAPHLLGVKLLASMRYMLFLGVPVSALGLEMAEPIIVTVYGQDYAPAVFALQVFMSIVFIGSFLHPSIGYLQSVDRQNINLAVTIFGAITNIILDIVLIKRYGLTGAVYASSATTVLLTMVMTTATLMLAKVRFPFAVTIRLLICGVLALFVIRTLTPPAQGAVGVIVDSAIFFAAYVPLSFLLGCWSRKDLKLIASLLKAAPVDLRLVRSWLLLLARRHPMLAPH